MSFDNDVQNIIKSVVKAKDIKNYEIGAIETNEKGEGFLGQIYMVTIKDKLSERKLNLILKLAFKDEALRESIPIRQSFENEIYFYQVIYPALEEFRKSTGCAKEYDLVPKCYKISLKNEMESLVLKNLKHQGFEIFSKKLDLTHELTELIFKRYGYFHACSLAFKDQNFEKFSEIVLEIKNVYQTFLDGKMFGKFMDKMCDVVYEILVPGEDDAIINDFNKYAEKAAEIFQKTIETDGKYSVIVHGDCWSNNMLFKYEKKSGKPIDMRLIDFQLMKVGSPICDLSYVLYSGAPKSILDQFYDYLEIYYDSFSSTLKKLGSDPEKLLPFNVLKQEWNTYSKFGFIMGAMVLRIKCTNSEDVRDFNDIDFQQSEDDAATIFDGKCDTERYDIKMRDLLTHMHKIGAL